VKKLTVISFLLLIFINQVGYYFIYSYQQHLIKEEIKEELLAGMPEPSLELIIEEDNINKLEWEEKGKEFYLNGEMYDVAKIKHRNGKTYLYCLNDKKEKELLAAYSKSIRDKSNKQTIKNQLSVYIVQKTEMGSLSFNISALNFSDFAISLNYSDKEIASPPPRA